MIKETEEENKITKEKVFETYKYTLGLLSLAFIMIIIVLASMQKWNELKWAFLALPFLIIFNIFFSYEFNKKYNYISDEMDKKRLKTSSLMFFYQASFIISYIGFAAENLVLMYVFGVIALLILFYNLWNVFLSAVDTDKHYKFFMVLELFIGLAITIYLIYRIPDIQPFNSKHENLQSIVTAITAAVYGGFITLSGVAWTIKNQTKIIKKQEENRKQEEIQKAKPLFAVRFMENEKFNTDYIVSLKNDKDYSKIIVGEFINSDNANFSVKGCIVDGEMQYADKNISILKGMTFGISILYMSIPEIDCYLIVEDILKNVYYYKLCHEQIDSSKFIIYSISNIQEISKEELMKKLDEKKIKKKHKMIML